MSDALLDRPRLREALDFAVRAHGDQQYSGLPYRFHLEAVVATLLRFDPAVDEDLLVAGYLHDTIEDAGVQLLDLREAFGDAVADLVFAVTNEPGETRREKLQRTYPKIAGQPGATRLKLADRIANVEACWNMRHRLLFRYHHEYPGFRGALRPSHPDENAAMWDALDALLGFR